MQRPSKRANQPCFLTCTIPITTDSLHKCCNICKLCYNVKFFMECQYYKIKQCHMASTCTLGLHECYSIKPGIIYSTNICCVPVAEMDHTTKDCFVCAILSHGGQCVLTQGGEQRMCDIIQCNDGIISAGDLWNCFTDDKAPTLKNKPRLFFIQVCIQTIFCKLQPFVFLPL